MLMSSQLQSDIGEMCNQGHQEENNRKMFMHADIGNLNFLGIRE